MPIVTEAPVSAFAHCPDPRCDGNEQEAVTAISKLVEVTYRDVGGELPGTDHSHEYLNFADADDAPCPVCSKHRELSSQERPVYMNASGQDPMWLIKRTGETERKVQTLEHERELDQLRRENENRDLRLILEQQQAQIAQLTASIDQKANKPGRKPAPTED